MARKFFVIKGVSGNLVAGDREAEEIIKKWKVGKGFSLTRAQARNPKFHRKVMAVAQMVIDNAPEGSFFHKKEAKLFVKCSMMTHGITEPMVNLQTGEITLTAKSIAFENMDDDEFDLVYSAVREDAASILGITEQEIDDNLAF